MDKMKAMIEDAIKMRNRYREMLETLENDEDGLSIDSRKQEMIISLKSAIQPLEDLLDLYKPKN